MVNTKKVLLNIFLVLIPLIAIISSILLYTKSKKEILGVTTRIESCTPYVSNILPRVAYVGQDYDFIPRIVGCENEELMIEVNGVNWLTVKEGYLITGVPMPYDVGTFKITITIKSATNEYIMEDYIIVKEYEE